MPEYIVLRGPGVDGVVLAAPFERGAGGQFVRLVLDPDSEPLMAPCVASVEVDGELCLAVGSRPICHVRVAVQGDRLVFRRPGDPAVVLDLSGAATAIGIPEPHTRRLPALQSKGTSEVLALVDMGTGEGLVPVWTFEGGVHGWLADQQHRSRHGDVRRAYAEHFPRVVARRKAYVPEHDRGDDVFVNPYTFVPLPEVIERFQPRGHASQGTDGLSGWFDVEWTFASEFVLPQDHPPIPLSGEVLQIPGSTVKGSVRSVHEVLANGCLRVFDGELMPIHREVTVVHDHWKVAVVRHVDVNGRVTSVTPCEELVWIDSDLLHGAIAAADVHSGLLVTVDLAGYTGEGDPTWRRPGGGRVLREGVPIRPGGDWVLHLTDSKARRSDKPYYVAAARLTGTSRDVEASAWQEFRDLAEDGADAVAARRAAQQAGLAKAPDTHALTPGSPSWPGIAVHFPPEGGALVGYRRAIDTYLGEGDTVWVSAGRGVVTALKPALLWRARGEHPAKDRVGSSLLACSDPSLLCRSCAVFGSAEVEPTRQPDARKRRSEQRSYGAHVRFSPLTSHGPVTTQTRGLPPLGSPRPSSGMFYLAHDAIDDKDPERDPYAPQPRPLSNWGSDLDKGRPRRLAGRKFYWHGASPQEHHPRHVRRTPAGQGDTQSRTVQVAPAGLVCTGRVWFDNLNKEQLGLLLCAVQPDLALSDLDGGRTGPNGQPVLAARTFAVHLGGGRPLGYGSVIPKVTQLTAHTAASRYAGKPAPIEQVADYAQLAREALPSGDLPAPPQWYALASVLDTARVPADRVWYPPAAYWSQRTRGPQRDQFNEKFDLSYTFFGVYRGGGMGRLANMQPMEPLPAAMDPSQVLPIARAR